MQFFQDISVLLTPACLGWMLVGTAVGILFGAMPGMSAALAVTVFLPVTYALDITTSTALLLSLYIGGISGGLISAILINIPGTPSSVATTFDGAPMARKGLGGKALGAGVTYSFLGTVLGVVVMVFLAPILARFAIKFGPYEYFAVTLCSLLLVAGLSGKDMIKGILGGLIGLTVGMVGLAPVDAAARFTFGFTKLNSGLNSIAVLVGIFALPEVLAYARKRVEFDKVNTPKIKGLGFTVKEFAENIVNFFRSALIGLAIGILPGIGAGTSNMLAYAAAKNSSKHPERFGQGEMAGIVASETANNAGIGGAMIPLLSLGIPGDAVTVILLAGFILKGVNVGPRFFTDNPSLANAIYGALLIGSILMFAMMMLGMRGFVKVMSVPLYFLLPCIMFICFIGAYAATNNIFNMWVMLVFGVLGYLLNHFEIPLGPLVIGFILGPTCETYWRRGMQMSDYSYLPFFESKIVCVIFAVAVLFIAWRVFAAFRKKRGVTEQKATEPAEKPEE